jgi:hypothetical protein
MFTRDSTCNGCDSPKESETSIQEQSGNLPATTGDIDESRRSFGKRSTIVEAIIGGGNLPATTDGVIEDSRRSLRKRKQDISVSNPSNKKVETLRPGSINTKASPGCRVESKNEVCPRSNNHSHELAIRLTSTNWNCLIGNTLNTMHALGHSEVWKSFSKPASLSENIFFSQLVHKLCNEYNYCIALSKLMTKDNSLKFKELENCINSARVPSLIILNSTYSGGQSRWHLIGKVPSVMIDNKSEMHIVDG